MQVAIPVWNGRISPVFESAGTVVILKVEERQQRAREEFQLADSAPPFRAKWLVDHNIDVLVCGAISRTFSDMIAASGITIIPWVCGEFEKVVEAVLADALPHPDFTMPGCCGRRIQASPRFRGGRRKGGPGGEGLGCGRGQGKHGAGRGGGRGRGPRGNGPSIH